MSPSPFGSVSYSWITTDCFQTSDYNGGNPACFPHGQTSQSVTGTNLRAEDAVDSLSCRATFSGITVTSSSIAITISGKSFGLNFVHHVMLFSSFRNCNDWGR